MKNLIILFILAILTGCSTQNKYSNFDYSFARSGGFAPMYENLLIKGNKVHYSYERQNTKIKKDFSISDAELKNIEEVLTANKFRFIQEDYKKLYDNISTIVTVKKGENSATKSNASQIMESDQQRWDNVTAVFQQIIDSRNLAESKK
ncbi:hypothetical protein [Kaistella carnis]|uniref:Uncharacterized protein n=1 Tax=Kaistella carnis TaxID=1241979 RepID=A0A3G8XR75_9FLAO|nr:hypothetical protein [Kaistella carnis]AZI34287.1 hypothetical protein EIB73_14355 [Kaistella carnis]